MYEKTIDLRKKTRRWSLNDDTGEPVSEQEIELAESELGFILCMQFNAYLNELGWLRFGGGLYLGLFAGEGR